MKPIVLSLLQGAGLIGLADSSPTGAWKPSSDNAALGLNGSYVLAHINLIRPRQDASINTEAFMDALIDSEINTSDPEWAFINDDISTWATRLTGFEGCDNRRKRLVRTTPPRMLGKVSVPNDLAETILDVPYTTHQSSTDSALDLFRLAAILEVTELDWEAS